MINLKIIGYYNHYNTGDEQYKISFLQVFDTYLNSEYTCDFLDCDTIYNKQFDETDIIILGGGDVLNNYFLDKIHKRFHNTNNLILAVSVGLPYVDTLIKSDKLNIISYIFLRTTVDLELFKKYFFDDRIFYLPDLSLLLKNNTTQNNNNYIEKLKIHKNTNKNIVVLSLSRHIYNKDYTTNYNNIITKLSEFCKILINLNNHIVFLPFNTNQINTNENDIIIHNDIVQLLNTNDNITNDNTTNGNITVIDEQLNVNEIFSIFELANLSISMRFHACLFSFYTNTPVIPIYTTRKIKNLLKELEWEHKYDLIKNEKDIPLDIDLDDLLYIYKNLHTDNNIHEKLDNINILLNKQFNENISNFTNCLKYSKQKNKDDKNKKDKLIDDIYEFVNRFIKSKGYQNLKDINDLHLQHLIVNIISYKLTNGCINSQYNYGLQEKIFDKNKDYNHITEWKWIISNELQKEDSNVCVNNINGLFNLKYIDQEDYSGCHRSGWQYVYKNLEIFHNDNSPVFLDLYVDRTFHWNLELNCVLNLIPYKNPWIGFIHHTFDESFSSYNCNTLFNCKEFIESLVFCKALFVLSKYLKDLFDIELKKRNLNIDVYVLMHPTELNVKLFSYQKFVNNKNKLLIHIGGWLRNIYSFYNIELPQSTKFYSGFLIGDKTIKPYGCTNHVIKKIALKGKNMNNYYPSNTFLLDLKKFLLKDSTDINTNDITNDITDITNDITDVTNDITDVNLPRSINLTNQEIIDNVIRLYYLRQYGTLYNQNISTNQHNLQRLHNLRRQIDIPSNCSSNQNFPNCSFDNIINNNWNKHFYDDIVTKINNIEFIEFLENDDYDNLLSENIVYINLVDASAVNTILECIVRATPIIVNKHPAVVELLGETYPLYFISQHNDYNGINLEINNMLKTDRLIRRAHYYLKRQNLNKFKIITFINNFSKILKNITITF